MKKTKFLAVFVVLALLICLLPVTAMASSRPQHGKPGSTEKTEVEETVEEAAEDAEEAEAADVDVAEEEDAVTEDAAEEAEEEDPAEAEPEDVEEEPEEAEEEIPFNDIVVDAEDVYYAYSGDIVFNNGGTVYNNMAIVYNNGGTVYNNGGTVYNNGGSVYSNSGLVYNNAGTVYSNGALVYYFEGSVEESRIYGYHQLTLAGDYEAFVSVEGLLEEPGTGSNILDKDSIITVLPNPGIAIVDAEADAGELSFDEDGNVVLVNVDADVTLTLTLQVDAPAFTVESGTYAEAQTVEITGPEGAEIYYTVDGTEPDAESGILYEEPFEVEASAEIQAIAVIEGVENSDVTTVEIAIPVFTAPVFDDVKEGYKVQPSAKAVTVDNSGSVAAVIESVELTGKDAESFTLSTESGKTLSAGKVDTFTWTVRPVTGLDKGEYEAEVIFTLDSGETVSVPVSITVTAGETA